MTSTHRTSAAALAAALATAALVVPAATARQASDPAQTDMRASVATALAAERTAPELRLASAQVAPREITARLKVEASRIVMHNKKKLRMGDALVERQRIFDTGDKPIGRAYLECTSMGGRPDRGTGVMQCQATYDFADGQIVAAGVVDIAKAEQLDAPIVGGSGAYRGARGELNAGAPVKGYDSVDVLKLDD